MKKSFVILVCLTLISSVFAVGKVIESIEMKSSLMEYPVKYSVYLPEDYDTSQRSYPVVYLLHGRTDDETSWIQFGELNRFIDEGIKSGNIPPAIFIMPDGKLTWYSNEIGTKNAWRDMFIKEFIPTIEKKYRIRAKKEFRAIAGISMGGFGALSISLTNPDLFSSCVVLSGGFYTDDELINMDDTKYANYFSKYCGENLKGKDRISTSWKAISPYSLIEKVPVEISNTVRYRLDCGNLDRFLNSNFKMHLKMDEYKIKHEFIVRNGNHGWVYWRESLPETLKFFGAGFIR